MRACQNLLITGISWTLLFGLSACQRSAQETTGEVSETSTTSNTAATNTTKKRPLMCEDPLEIELPAPKPDGATATFEVDPGGDIEPNLGCQAILIGSERKLSQGNETFTIAAHETELQRIRVGHTTVLVHVLPGTNVKIGTHPCFSWQFLSPDLTVEGAVAPDAACPEPTKEEDAESACPEGMVETRSRLASDPLCEDVEDPQYRCVKPTLVTLLPPSAWTKPVTYAEVGAVEDSYPSLPGPFEPPLEVVPASCGFLRVDTSAERVGLAVGVGQVWELRVDPGGKLSGSVSSK